MFTPQRKGWAGWTLSPTRYAGAGGDGADNGPRSVNRRSGASGAVAFGKGKGVVEAPPPPPPQALLGENGGGGAVDGGEAEVWRRFREAGLLDESALKKKDHEALLQRISELEKELHDYQYNMGLLLIEKKDWASSYEEIMQRFSEAEEILKREQAAHIIQVSEFEKREENMRKALGVEKQCVADLEKALREMRGEIAEVKFTADKKLTEAHALEASLEEKYLEVEGKLHSADAKLAEASRKSSEIDRKLEDVEARERKLHKEYLTLNTERKVYEKDHTEQREHLRDWEKKLQDSQKRLLEGQRFLNEREDRANEMDKILKKKEEEIEEARKLIEVTKNSLKVKEDDISTRLRSLAAKEKEADDKIQHLEKKEKELLAIEEKLNARERVEIQKLLDDHNAALELKKQDFDLELERRRTSFDEEMKSKLDAVEKKKIEIDCKEDQIIKREQTVENKMQKLQEKEKDLDTKSKALKKWEASIKNDEKKLEEEKQQFCRVKQELENSKTELESLKAAIEAEKQQNIIEAGNLRLTQEEREQHFVLQSKLKQELEDYRMLKDSVIKETEDLKQQREKFEKEWEELDEKRVALEAESKKVNDDRLKFEKWRHNEEERLKNEDLAARANVQRELEELRLKKEAFENAMELEKLNAQEVLKRDRADIARELELRKHELEMDVQKKWEEMEKKLLDKENQFERKRDAELSQIESSSRLIESKLQKLKMEQDQLQQEKEEVSMHYNKLEADRQEIQKDIDTLRLLSRNLKDQREEFVKERERFLALAEQCKICKNCGVPLSDLELLTIQRGIEDARDIQLPSLALEEHLKGKSIEVSRQGTGSHSVTPGGGRFSRWMGKCTSIFHLSPGKKAEDLSECQAEQSISFGARLDREASDGEANYDPAPTSRVAIDSFDTQKFISYDGVGENEKSERVAEAGDEPEPSFGIADNLTDSRQVESEQNIPLADGNNEREGSSLPPENDLQPELGKQGRRQPGKRGRGKINRTRSVKEVVEEGKAYLGETFQEKNARQPNGDAKGSLNTQEESQGDSVRPGMVATSSRQKRGRAQTYGMTTSELDAEDSETHSESVSIGGRRKRRQMAAPGAQTPGQKRYDFRHSTRNATAKGLRTGPSPGNEILKDARVGTSEMGAGGDPSSGFIGENKQTLHMLQKSAAGDVVETHETSQKLVRFEVEDHPPESDGDIVVRYPEFSEQSAEDGIVVDGAAMRAEPATPSDGGTGGTEGEEDDEDEESEKHEASIGKKLWTFFTT